MKKGILIMSGSIVVFGILCFLLLDLNTKLVIELEGSKELTLDVNTEYKEEGFKAYFNDQDVTNNVIVNNDVDLNKVGKYKIKYKVKNKNKVKEIDRVIDVVDRTSPVITLKGNNIVLLDLNHQYQELGYEVTDNYDKALNDKVVITNNIDNLKEGLYEVIYKVSDSSGNKAELKREVRVLKQGINVKLPVLMYHFFYDDINGAKPNDNNWMAISLFEQQIKYLKENNYYFPTWEEVNDYLDKKISLPEKSIVITADDGNSSFFELAYPILKKYNVRATSFIVTSWVTPDNKYDKNILNYQSHSDNMHRGGCSGGHGGIFRCINDSEGLNDLIKSKKIANNASVFCYPFGDVTDKGISLVQKAGYKMAFTTIGGKISPGMDKYKLPRVRMSNGISLDKFISLIK